MNAQETRRLLNEARVYDTIGFAKMMNVIAWTVMKSEKANRFMENLSKGMNAYSAYNDAQRLHQKSSSSDGGK